MSVKAAKAAVEVSVGEPITLESATVCTNFCTVPASPLGAAPCSANPRAHPRRAQGDESVSLDLLSESVADFEASPQNLFAQNAVTRNPVTELLIDRDAHTEINHHFSASLRSPESLGLELIPANQFSTGRCWLFAMMNTIRLPLVKKLNLPLTFELSQSYMMFWDKVERTNFFLETMIETADEPLDGRLIQFLLSNPIQDAVSTVRLPPAACQRGR